MFGTGGTTAKEDEEEEDTGKPMTRQLLLDKIRQKKEVINKLRCQAWSMNRKRRTLRLAQKYLEQHESKVSKTHLYKEELRKRFRMFSRWFSNINTYLIPWESRIKKIESHFGSVVSSYFTFLRWVLYMNVVITVIVLCFITIPEVSFPIIPGRNIPCDTCPPLLKPKSGVHSFSSEFTFLNHLLDFQIHIDTVT